MIGRKGFVVPSILDLSIGVLLKSLLTVIGISDLLKITPTEQVWPLLARWIHFASVKMGKISTKWR
ncbi:hypothetical protein FHX15_005166 [Rhizobium sp. BK650]|nr:hypothetical protein [Rhizobium sp. BK650]